LLLQNEGLVVKDVVVLIDREQGGEAHLAKNRLNLHAAFKLSQLLSVLVKHGKVRRGGRVMQWAQKTANPQVTHLTSCAVSR
jgi:orotate phosphoribosyltransferase